MAKKKKKVKVESRGKKWKVSVRIPKFLIPKDEPIIPRPFSMIDYAGGILVFLFSFGVYLHTLTPTVGLHDSGEMIAGVYVLGIIHPPGYPFYCLLGKLWLTILFIGNIAYRMNLLSALSASLAVMMVYFITLKIGARVIKVQKEDFGQLQKLLLQLITLIPAIVTGLMLCFATTFWIQAVIAEKYTLNTCFATLLIFILIKWQEVVRSKTKNNLTQNFSLPPCPVLLYLFSFIAGLSFTHHFQTMYLIPASICLILFISWQAWIKMPASKIKKDGGALSFSLKRIVHNLLIFKPIPVMLLLVILPLSLYLYLPLRAHQNPSVNWNDPDTLERFIDHISADDYKDYMIPNFEKRMKALKFHINRFFTHQFTPYLIWLGPVGAITLLIMSPNIFIFLILIILMNILAAGSYSIPNIEDYYLPSFAVFAIFSGCGIMGIIRLITLTISKIGSIFFSFSFKMAYFLPLSLSFLPLLILPFKINYPYSNRHQHYFAYDYGRNILAPLEENAVVFTKGDLNVFSFLYLQNVEKWKPKIAFIDISFLHHDWYALQVKQKRPELRFELYPEERIIKLKSRTKKELKPVRFDELVSNNLKNYPFYVFFDEEVSGFAMNYPLVTQGFYWRIARDENDKVEKTNAFLKQGLKLNLRGIYDNLLGDDGLTLDIRRAIGFRKDYAVVYNNLGVIYYQKEMFQEAVENFKKAISINPNYLEPHLFLGMVYEQEKKYKEAIRYYKKTIALNLNSNSPYIRLGNIYLTQHKYIEAISVFQKAVEIFPQDINALYNLGKAYYKNGDIDNTCKILNRMLEIDPNRDDIRQSLLFLKSGKNISWN